MKIYYGIDSKLRDITDVVLAKTPGHPVFTIPASDLSRANIFGDHLPGVLKKVVIVNENGERIDYTNEYIIKIDATTREVSTINNRDIEQKLQNIQSTLVLYHGSFSEELSEQKMAVMYLTGSEKVLEIGGNIGRNTLIIASILKNAAAGGSLVSLECSPYISEFLTQNRDANNLDFYIENSALSNRKLVQKGWDTFPMENDVIPNEYTEVKTITLNELKQKYSVEFDTLVLDCEGAFYYILMDMPEILNGINLIIMENDYHNISHKQYIDRVMLENNFYRDYVERGEFGWGPCKDNFFEVWKKNI
jgi:FkbM family methyltransferase